MIISNIDGVQIMNTVVKNWHIVSISEGEELIGKILWGICVDCITTSKIVEISPHNKLIKTASGRLYQVIGEGQKSQLQMKDFDLLRHGFSPKQNTQLNLAPNDFFH